ncbi:MAG: GNAT family N-acetyltransferase, partial [Lysobacterales bacterium]
MNLTLRDARETDLDQLLGMNNAAGAAILPIDGARMRHLFREAAYFRVAQIDDHLAGFLIGLDADADYDSSNYRFFAERYESFTYIDRIVIAAAY